MSAPNGLHRCCFADNKKERDIFLNVPLFLYGLNLVDQVVRLASIARKEYAIAVATLDSYLENLKIRSQIVLHNRNCFIGLLIIWLLREECTSVVVGACAPVGCSTCRVEIVEIVLPSESYNLECLVSRVELYCI